MLNNEISQQPFDESRFRQLYEAYEQLGIPLNTEALVERFKALERGLPAEDEFATLVTWLGKCELIHKLDQVQLPLSSTELYQVPDFFAVFNVDGKEIPVLIEVKSQADISLSPKRLEKYKRYADLLNLPLLIAWKCQKYRRAGFTPWILFDLGALKIKDGDRNYKISFEDALKENLLSLLAGEFMINIKAGVGLHLKLELIGDQTDWQLMKEKGSYHGQIKAVWTDGYGNEIPISQMSAGLLALLNCIPSLAESSRNDGENTIVQSFILADHTTLFAHQMLPILLTETKSLPERFRWRNIVKDGLLPISADTIHAALNPQKNKNVVNYMFHLLPNSMPSFLQDIQH